MKKKLIVVVPAIGSRKKYWQPLIDKRLQHEPELKGAVWFFWNHGAGLFSFRRAEEMARDLHAILDAKQNEEKYDEIILIGHSLGGVLIRASYLMSVDTTYVMEGTSDWGQKVSRIILLAAINKGVQPRKVPFRFIAVPFVNFLNTFKKLLITDLWIGSAFITNLRIGWISYFGSNQSNHLPVVIQLLGTMDGIVSADDSIDVVQFKNAEHVIVPDANHKDLYHLDGLKDPAAQEIRYGIIKRAIIDRLPSERPSAPIAPGTKELVVFILPGIRDASSEWTIELRKRLVDSLPSAKIEIANYGYFSAGKFFLPWKRRKNVRIFQDQYSDCLAKNPNAEFHCVSHSNGSYILGRSLQYLPKMKFNRVFLAGSVLPEDYNWGKCFNNAQVLQVRNDRAAKDWPVAILCKSMRSLGMKDVGVAGFDGFQFQVTENHFYNGGHGEAIRPKNHSLIVDYILKGENQVRLNGRVTNGFRLLSNLSPWLVKLFALIVVGVILFSFYLILQDQETGYYLLGGTALVLLILYVVLDIV